MREKIAEILSNVEKVKREYCLTQNVVLVAATKMVEAERINRLPALGVTIAGENRVQELLEKYDDVEGMEWHLIGALQTNKVKYVVDKVKLIHSLDRKSLADEIEKQAAKRGITVNVLVEINVGGEKSKSGISPEKAEELMEYVSSLKHVNLRGIMSVLPIHADDSLYEQMREFSVMATNRFNAPILSMGMSGDYERAVRYGSNMIRIGSAVFGKRNYQN